MPLPNDFSGGDGLRTANFTAPEANTSNEHFAVLRLDHKINDKWDFMASYRYSVSAIQPQISRRTLAVQPRLPEGVACALASGLCSAIPRRRVDGADHPKSVNDFHFDWLRTGVLDRAGREDSGDPQFVERHSSADLAGKQNGRYGPINVNTQQARQRVWNGQDYTWTDNLSWIKGKHAFSFGGGFKSSISYMFAMTR